MLATPGERQLVTEVVAALDDGARLLNIGAGSSVTIEDQLHAARNGFTVDRVDVDDPTVAHPVVRDCRIGSIEALPLADGVYDAAFANYVMEHVHDLDAAARETRRVLRRGGMLIVSVPNPSAPEFVLSRLTPLWLHRAIRGREAWPTVYAFRTPDDLAARFEQHGFETLSVYRFPFVTGYLHRYPLLRQIGTAYDGVVARLHLRSLMGNACIVWRAI